MFSEAVQIDLGVLRAHRGPKGVVPGVKVIAGTQQAEELGSISVAPCRAAQGRKLDLPFDVVAGGAAAHCANRIKSAVIHCGIGAQGGGLQIHAADRLLA